MATPTEIPPARPAATVIVAREGTGGFEVLMLKRSDVGPFEGMWVFPGGRVDDDDAGEDEIARAASAAVREAREEVALEVDPAHLITLSHWTPPAIAPKRFTTWFFVVPWAGGEAVIDDHEIVESRWLTPAETLDLQLPVAPPTLVTLLTLQQAGTFEGLRSLVARRGVERFVTVPTKLDDRLVLLWEGDAGYDSADATVPGARHRMVMVESGPMTYERSLPER